MLMTQRTTCMIYNSEKTEEAFTEKDDNVTFPIIIKHIIAL